MVLQSGDVIAYLSAVSGSSGGVISASTITSGVMNNLWPDITDVERLSGGSAYRKMFFKNESLVDEMILPVLYAPSLPDNMTLSLGLGFNDADDDDPFQGNMSSLTSNSAIAIISDGVDTRDVTVWGNDVANNPTVEILTLNGTTEVVGATTFSKVWAVQAEVQHATNTIEVRKGAAGQVLGAIEPGTVHCWLWVASPDAKNAGITLPDLGPGEPYGLWLRLAWSAGMDPVRPNNLTFTIEEA